MSQKYTLTFINDTPSEVFFTCFPQSSWPQTGRSIVYPAAWFVAPADPQDQVGFSWEMDYSYVWGPVTDFQVKPGFIFELGGKMDVPPETNTVGFTFNSGAFSFENPGDDGAPGSLSIANGESVPMTSAAVGINIEITDAPKNSVSAVALIAAAITGQTVSFSAPPSFWITPNPFAPGEVIGIGDIPTPTEVTFPSGVFALTCRYLGSQEWQITPTP